MFVLAPTTADTGGQRWKKRGVAKITTVKRISSTILNKKHHRKEQFACKLLSYEWLYLIKDFICSLKSIVITPVSSYGMKTSTL